MKKTSTLDYVLDLLNKAHQTLARSEITQDEYSPISWALIDAKKRISILLQNNHKTIDMKDSTIEHTNTGRSYDIKKVIETVIVHMEAYRDLYKKNNWTDEQITNALANVIEQDTKNFTVAGHAHRAQIEQAWIDGMKSTALAPFDDEFYRIEAAKYYDEKYGK